MLSVFHLAVGYTVYKIAQYAEFKVNNVNMKKSKVREDALKYRYNSPDDVVIGDQVSKGERVKDISFDVKKNQILAILGPERSGKSSLL
jgi:ABC-type multidrug transport system fused ATPase/permease subunit